MNHQTKKLIKSLSCFVFLFTCLAFSYLFIQDAYTAADPLMQTPPTGGSGGTGGGPGPQSGPQIPPPPVTQPVITQPVTRPPVTPPPTQIPPLPAGTQTPSVPSGGQTPGATGQAASIRITTIPTQPQTAGQTVTNVPTMGPPVKVSERMNERVAEYNRLNPTGPRLTVEGLVGASPAQQRQILQAVHPNASPGYLQQTLYQLNLMRQGATGGVDQHHLFRPGAGGNLTHIGYLAGAQLFHPNGKPNTETAGLLLHGLVYAPRFVGQSGILTDSSGKPVTYRPDPLSLARQAGFFGNNNYTIQALQQRYTGNVVALDGQRYSINWPNAQYGSNLFLPGNITFQGLGTGPATLSAPALGGLGGPGITPAPGTGLDRLVQSGPTGTPAGIAQDMRDQFAALQQQIGALQQQLRESRATPAASTPTFPSGDARILGAASNYVGYPGGYRWTHNGTDYSLDYTDNRRTLLGWDIGGPLADWGSRDRWTLYQLERSTGEWTKIPIANLSALTGYLPADLTQAIQTQVQWRETGRWSAVHTNLGEPERLMVRPDTILAAAKKTLDRTWNGD